jgi:homocysteine S-methyltransferase
MHMSKILQKLTDNIKPVFILPNAGYPEMINGRVCYVLNPEYYAETLVDCITGSIKAIGGCCGTTPKHIALLKSRLNNAQVTVKEQKSVIGSVENKSIINSTFGEKLKSGEFVVAVELDPPFKPDCTKLLQGARLLKEAGVDIITIADSPMGKSRVDSVITSVKLKKEVGVEVLPHICCRDKNAVSLRSVLLGAYMEDIRNVLVVTGDPVPGEFRSDIKSVFNMNSYSLIDMVSQMNDSVFDEGNICIGGAVNFNVRNKSSELSRLLKKHENGAYFFLTQPIFDEETIDFVKKLPKDRDYKILAGVMPPVSYKNVMFLNNELAGVTIPDSMVARFTPDMTREEAQSVGEDIACDIITSLKDYVDGFYLIAPFNRCEMIKDIIKKTGLK